MAANMKKPYCDRISAFWDNEKSSPSVVPRLLYMEIDQLCLNCPSSSGTAVHTSSTTAGIGTTGNDVSVSGHTGTPSGPSAYAGPVYLAIKMPAQRALRSQQIPPPPPLPSLGQIGNVNSSLSSLDSQMQQQERRILVEIQYPHAIKRDNPLLVMIQRRRKYKNLGFKTLGAACVNLTDILQMRLTDTRLPLLPESIVTSNKQQKSVHQQQPIGYLHVVRLETLPAPATRASKASSATAAAAAASIPAAPPTVDDDDYLGAASEDDDVGPVDDEEAASAAATAATAAAAAAAAAAKAKKEAVFGAKPKEWRQKLKLFMDESFSTILKSRKLKPGHNFELEMQQEESMWNDLDDIEPPDSSSSLDDDDDVSIGSTPKPSVRRYFGSQSSDCRLSQQQPQQQQQQQHAQFSRHYQLHPHPPSSTASALLMTTNEAVTQQQQSFDIFLSSDAANNEPATSFDVAAPIALASLATGGSSSEPVVESSSSAPSAFAVFDAPRRQSLDAPSAVAASAGVAPVTPAKLPPLILLQQQQQQPLLSPPQPHSGAAASSHSLSVNDYKWDQQYLHRQQQQQQLYASFRHQQQQQQQQQQQKQEQHKHRARSHTASCVATALLPTSAAAAAAASVLGPAQTDYSKISSSNIETNKSPPGGGGGSGGGNGRRRSLASQRELANAMSLRQVVACLGLQPFQMDFNFSDQFFREPRKECTEAVARLHGDCLPEKLCLINTGENGGRALLEALQQQSADHYSTALTCIPTVTAADCRHAMAHIASSLGHQSSSSSAAAAAAAAASSAVEKPAVHKICIVGSDAHVNSVLRAYVEQFGSKPSAWQSRVRFYYAPLLGSVALARLLCSADSADGYGSLWGDSISGFLSSALELSGGSTGGWSAHDTAHRIRRYLSEADSQIRLPVGEVLLAESADGAQTFVPFVLHVRLGQADRSAESDSELPTAADDMQQQQQQQMTPPGSPSLEAGRPAINLVDSAMPIASSSSSSGSADFVDLQLDYWTGGSDRRTALKPALRALRVCQAASGRGLTLSLVNKRQKIMRLGKKAKEPESRREIVEGLTRLICTGKSQPMRVFVDGVEWSGVKFFQLSSQWQTSVKFLPVAVYSPTYANNGVCLL